MIEAAPLPTHADIQITPMLNPDTTEKANHLALILTTPAGAHVTYWDPNSAEALGKALQQKAREARSGLVVVDATAVPTAPKHNGRTTKGG